MHSEDGTSEITTGQLIKRFIILLSVSLGVGVSGHFFGLDSRQAVSCSVFIGIIMGTLFFWNFRLAIAFIGLSVLIFTNSLNIEMFVQSSALEVILFLVGMMIIVGALRDLGFFTWIVQLIVSMPNINGRKFIAVTAVSSALLACAVDEVTSIIFIATLIFQVCDRLKLNPTPYILICVLSTNVGSAGTMMGNPVGIYIGTKGGLTFGDFIIWAFPLMLVALLATVALTMFYYRKDLDAFDRSLRERMARDLSLVPKVDVPYRQGLILLSVTIALIASHHQLENIFGLGKNSILLIAPLVCSGVVMIIRRKRARHYVEREVDWWTLLFFMLLFAIAGTLEHTHVDQVMASNFTSVCGDNLSVLIPFVISVTAVGSAFVDNVIFVAAFSPVIEKLSIFIKDLPLWWALLFGACFGGNITMIGSTANIVALGMLEKRSHIHIKFFDWLKIGLVSALLACGIAWGGLMLLTPLMPDRYSSIDFELLSGELSMKFDGKAVEFQAEYAGPGREWLLKGVGENDYICVRLVKSGYYEGTPDFIYGYIPRKLIEKNLSRGEKYNIKGQAYGLEKLTCKAVVIIDSLSVDSSATARH
jgi:Na+/H+ antiporter NhaD/arsenite permease-like protein